MRMGAMFSTIDLAVIQSHFTWNIAPIQIDISKSDGEGGNRGSSPANIFKVRSKIYLDTSDVPIQNGIFNIEDPRALETVYHELIHCDQDRRGFFYRLKMAFWRLTKPYEKRPHEIEARAIARVLANS